VSAGFLISAARAAIGNVKEWTLRYGSPGSSDMWPGRPFLQDDSGGCGIIAEVKMRSPSRGDLMGESDPERLAELYERAGAEAVSVVVEEKYFGGSPELFQRVRKNITLPMLWKDFVVDPFQVRLAAALGASAVLLIVDLVPDNELKILVDAARESGLAPLVEIHNEGELERALGAGADLVGVNNRDLVSLKVDPGVSQRIASRFPEGLPAVSESGMKDPGDVGRMADLGFRAVLVGEALITAEDPGALLAEMVKRGKKDWTRRHGDTGTRGETRV